MTTKPTVVLENFKEVYQYVRDNPPDSRMTMLGQAGMSYIMHPRCFAVPGTLESLRDHSASNGQLLLIGNHVKGIDPLVVSVMQARIGELAFTRTHTSGIVKTSIMQNTVKELSVKGVKSLANPVVRWGVEQMRSIPAFREKDYQDEAGNIPQDKKRLLSAASMALLGVTYYRLEQGEHIAMYPEGERNKTDPLVVQEFMQGAAMIGKKGHDVTGGNLAIQTFGTYYGDTTLRPTVVLGDFINPAEHTRKELTKVMHDAVQHAVTVAADLHKQ